MFRRQRGKKEKDFEVWQDREVRFDGNPEERNVRRGEFIIDSLFSVEDTKGNNGERGPLVLTNLRLIWCRQDRPSTNLSIGFNCIITLESRRAKSRLRGSTQSLRVLTKFNGTRFEFIFTSLVKSNPRLFGTIQAVRKSYESTKLYRNVKLRSAIVDDGKLMILPQEEVINTLSGVWNLSTDQGNLGTLITTNVRVVWFAHMAENFCVSAPWMQVKDITLKDTSKFGTALVIDILPAAGGYKMGFNLEPKEQLESMFQELLSLFAVFRATPVFGVDFKEEGMRKIGDTEADAAAPSVLDDLNVVQAENEGPASFPAYLLDPSKEQDREVVFDPHLGLAVEGLLGNTTTTSLWQAVATLAPVDTEGRRASQQMGRKHGPDHGPQPTGPGGHQAAEYKYNDYESMYRNKEYQTAHYQPREYRSIYDR